jgi:hypothetical protein
VVGAKLILPPGLAVCQENLESGLECVPRPRRCHQLQNREKCGRLIPGLTALTNRLADVLLTCLPCRQSVPWPTSNPSLKSLRSIRPPAATSNTCASNSAVSWTRRSRAKEPRSGGCAQLFRAWKNATITELLSWLRQRLGNRFVVTDYWDADLSAVGISAPDDPAQLVYISSWGRPARNPSERSNSRGSFHIRASAEQARGPAISSRLVSVTNEYS